MRGKENEMARNGYRIFDSDTHVGPYMEVLEKYLTDSEKTRLQGWDRYKSVSSHGNETYNKGQRIYRRRMGDAKADQAPAGYMAGFTGVKRERDVSRRGDHDPAERIKDLDYE